MTGADKEDDFVGEVVEFAGASLTIGMRSVTSEKVLPPEANFRNKAETEAKKGHAVKMETEQHGLSVLFQLDDDVFHTYSVYARGCDSPSNAYRLLDQTPMGGNRTSRTRSPAGHRSRRMDKLIC